MGEVKLERKGPFLYVTRGNEKRVVSFLPNNPSAVAKELRFVLRELGVQDQITISRALTQLVELYDKVAEQEKETQEETIVEQQKDAKLNQLKQKVDELTTKDLTAKELSAEIARLLKEEYRFATLNDTEEVLIYNDGIYHYGGEAFIRSTIEKILEQSIVTKNLCEEVIGHIQRSTYINRKNFDADPSFIVLNNCVLDLEKNCVFDHTPEIFSLTKLPISYDPKADCPKIKKFLNEVLFPEDIATIQEFLGYLLWKRYVIQKALLLVGDGNNGKSTFIGLVRAFLGNDNVSGVSLQELELNRFAKADLYGKLANLYADLPDSALKSVGTFKMLTGGDPIRGEHKFKNSFLFINYAKLIFSANKVPEVYEDTEAFFRRWIIITFPNKFEGNKADPNKLSELTTPEELSGLLNWALEGLQRLKANGWRFSNPKSTEDIRTEYIRKSSPMKAFFLDCIEFDTQNDIPKKELYAKFCDYCRERKLPAVTEQTFYANIQMHIKVEETRPTINKKRVPCYRGIKLKPKEEWGKSEDEESSGQFNISTPPDSPDSPDRKEPEPNTPVSPVNPVRGCRYFISTKSEPLQKDSDVSKKQPSDIESGTSGTDQSSQKCQRCGAELKGGFFKRNDGSLWCLECMRKEFEGRKEK